LSKKLKKKTELMDASMLDRAQFEFITWFYNQQQPQPQSFEIETSNNNDKLSQYNKIKKIINETIGSMRRLINDGYDPIDSQKEQEEDNTPEGEQVKKYLNELLETLKSNIESLKIKSNDTKQDITQLLNEFINNINFNTPFNKLKRNFSDKLNELSVTLKSLLDNSNPYKQINDNDGIELPTKNNTTTTNDISNKYSKALEFAKKYSEDVSESQS
jgi:hypothetical protein